MNSPASPQPEIKQFNSEDIISKYDLHQKLDRYFEYLLDYNQKINLVSRETSLDDLFRIAADCLVPFEYIDPPKGRIFDIGPGGGFPSIILLLIFPELKADLIERTGKKAEYLRQVVKKFNLSAKIENGNFIEVVSQLDPDSYDYGFIKLVRLDRIILKNALRLLSNQSKLIYYNRLILNTENLNKFSASANDYYLDDNNRVRSFSVFSKGSKKVVDFSHIKI